MAIGILLSHQWARRCQKMNFKIRSNTNGCPKCTRAELRFFLLTRRFIRTTAVNYTPYCSVDPHFNVFIIVDILSHHRSNTTRICDGQKPFPNESRISTIQHRRGDLRRCYYYSSRLIRKHNRGWLVSWRCEFNKTKFKLCKVKCFFFFPPSPEG